MKPEIQRLIDLSVKDDRITERQREIILKKAAMLEDDIDEVEFLLAGYTIVPNNKPDRSVENVVNPAPVVQGYSPYQDIKMQMQQIKTQMQQFAGNEVNYKDKNKTVAGLLGIFLGGFGAHKFYLGKKGSGIVYLLFCWAYIPVIIGFIEGITYLCMSEEKFKSKYLSIL